jgi:mono/diheme cytochrome c family protein
MLALTMTFDASQAHVSPPADSADAPAAAAEVAPGATESGLPELADQVLADPQSATIAETVFYQNCAYCHGSLGSGGKARPLQCRDLKPENLYDVITNGRKRGSMIMPPWKDSLDDLTRWQLVAYIRTLKDLPNCSK